MEIRPQEKVPGKHREVVRASTDGSSSTAEDQGATRRAIINMKYITTFTESIKTKINSDDLMKRTDKEINNNNNNIQRLEQTVKLQERKNGDKRLSQ